MIRDKEDVLVFLQGAIAENGLRNYCSKPLATLPVKRYMAQLAQEWGIDRSGLYKSFSTGGKSVLPTVAKVLDNLGFGISIYKRVS